MKKLLSILLALVMLSACTAEKPVEKPITEKENTEEMTLDIVKDCIFKENGKYGIQHEGKIIAEAHLFQKSHKFDKSLT